jgi:hypothetical protein
MADQGTDRGHSPPRWVRPANHHLGNARGGRQVAVYISFVIVAVRRSTVSPSPVALGEGRRRARRYLPRAADKRDEGAPFQLIELQRHPPGGSTPRQYIQSAVISQPRPIAYWIRLQPRRAAFMAPMLWRLRTFPDFCEPHCRAAVGWGTVDRGISSKMLRLPLILLMTCAFALSAHAQRRDSMKNARDDVEAAKKLPSVQPAPPQRSDSTTVTIIRKMKRQEYSVPRSN